MKTQNHILTIKEIKQKAIPIVKKYGITKAALFGSYAKGFATHTSDIDLLVESPDDISLLDFIHIKNEFEDIFNRKVDLVEFGDIKKTIKQEILQSKISIL